MLSIMKLSILAFVLLGSVVSATAVPPLGWAALLPPPTDPSTSALYHVNVHRNNHSAPFVIYNCSLQAEIQARIGGCGVYDFDNPVANSNSMTDSGSDDAGNPNYDIAGALSSFWYDSDSIHQYVKATKDYTQPPPKHSLDDLETNTFTRMIWKAQESMGCWAQECGPGTPFYQNQLAQQEPDSPGDPPMDWTRLTICAFYPDKWK